MRIKRICTKLCGCALDLLYPPFCLECSTPLLFSEQSILCTECSTKLEYIGANSCWFCSTPLGKYGALQKECDECRGRKLSFTRLVATCVYNQTARAVVLAFKFGNSKHLYKFMTDLMLKRLEQEYSGIKFDYVVPVPLHKHKLKERGYNQSALLARDIALRAGFEYSPGILRRVRYTVSQSLLSAEERQSNLSQAFAAIGSFPNATVLLVDDVCTTGVTLHECALTLRAAGARRIYSLVFAR